MLLSMKQVDLIKEYALGNVFSDTARMDYTVLLEELEEGNIPDGVVVWQPFEHLLPWELVERVEEQYEVFEVFVEKLLRES